MSEQPPPLHLRVFFEQQLVGDLTARQEEGEARFRFTYRGERLRSASHFALSVPRSLPEEPYGHQETRAYLKGRLRWA